MSENKTIRIDKFLWAVRIYKTRSLASEECRKGRIILNNIEAKPSRIVARNDTIMVRKLPVVYTFQVLEPVEKRVSAKLVSNYIKDLTPEEEKTRLVLAHSGLRSFRARGTGRPTKKERRNLDQFIDGLNDQ